MVFQQQPTLERPDRNCSGFSLLEVLIGIFVLTVGFMGMTSLFVLNERSHVLANEEAAADDALRNMAERIRSGDFEDIVSTYTNYSFTVGDIGGTGSVTLFTDETDTSADAAQLGLPRDLDGDGAVSDGDVSDNYALLPVKVEVTWDAAHGTETGTLFMLLGSENWTDD